MLALFSLMLFFAGSATVGLAFGITCSWLCKCIAEKAGLARVDDVPREDNGNPRPLAMLRGHIKTKPPYLICPLTFSLSPTSGRDRWLSLAALTVFANLKTCKTEGGRGRKIRAKD
jgi:hypothetical protein